MPAEPNSYCIVHAVDKYEYIVLLIKEATHFFYQPSLVVTVEDISIICTLKIKSRMQISYMYMLLTHAISRAQRLLLYHKYITYKK